LSFFKEKQFPNRNKTSIRALFSSRGAARMALVGSAYYAEYYDFPLFLEQNNRPEHQQGENRRIFDKPDFFPFRLEE